MTIPLPEPPPTLIVPDNTPCRSCGYNLRTLAITGNCPECATPVAGSLGGPLLRNADPGFLRKLDVGMKLMQGGLWCYMLSMLIAQGIFALNAILIWLAWCGMPAGTWLVTCRDPSGLGEERYRTLRLAVRGLGVFVFADFFVTVASPQFAYFTRQLGFPIFFVWGLCLLFYLRGLGKRTAPVRAFFTLDGVILAYSAVSVLVVVLASVFLPRGIQSVPVRFILLHLASPLILWMGMNLFQHAFKAEVLASRSPRSFARAAGSFVRSIRKFFGGPDSRDNKPG